MRFHTFLGHVKTSSLIMMPWPSAEELQYCRRAVVLFVSTELFVSTYLSRAIVQRWSRRANLNPRP
jgi:hypothetical protein